MNQKCSGLETKRKTRQFLEECLAKAIAVIMAKEISLDHLKENKEKVVEGFVSLIQECSVNRNGHLNLAKMEEQTGIPQDQIWSAVQRGNDTHKRKNLGEALQNYFKMFYSPNQGDLNTAIKQLAQFFY